MHGHRPSSFRPQQTRGKSPAERAEEFGAAQRRLKQEAAARREEAKVAESQAARRPG